MTIRDERLLGSVPCACAQGPVYRVLKKLKDNQRSLFRGNRSKTRQHLLKYQYGYMWVQGWVAGREGTREGGRGERERDRQTDRETDRQS